MFLGQHLHKTNAVRLRAVATPRVNPSTLRSSCIARGKTTAAQLRERQVIEASVSSLGTPVVDYLLESSPYSKFLDEEAITSMRQRERSMGDATTAEKLRRLRIGFANKGRKPWNAGKHHTPGTIERIRKGVARAMKDPAVIAKLRKKYVPQTPESRVRMQEKLRLKFGVQLHRSAFGSRLKNCNAVATTGVAVFHCHIGCSAMLGFHRVGWRRSLVYTKRKSSKRKVRRRMTEEEKAASKERARQRCAEIMKQKWQDPEYRERQKEAIRASHKVNPRRPKKSVGKSLDAPRATRSKLSPLQARLERDTTAFQAALQELRQNRAYCAKFEGVVSKLQAQADALNEQPEAQQQVQQALDGVLASQETALQAISALEQKVVKLQAQVESTKMSVARQQRDQGAGDKAAETSGWPEASPDTAASSRDSLGGGAAGATGLGTSGPGGVPAAGRAGAQGLATSEPSLRSRLAARDLHGGVPEQRGATGSGAVVGSATAGSGGLGHDGGAVEHSDEDVLKGGATEAGPSGSVFYGHSAGVTAVRPGHARPDDAAAAQRPLGEHSRSGNGNSNGNGSGLGMPGVDGLAAEDGLAADGRVNSGYSQHSVDLDGLTGLSSASGPLTLPTAAEWKSKMLDTSQNGHVVTDALSARSDMNGTDGTADLGRGGSALLVEAPPSTDGVRVDSATAHDAHTDAMQPSRGLDNGRDAHRQTADEIGEDSHDEEQDSLGWLKGREHKLPWQQ